MPEEFTMRSAVELQLRLLPPGLWPGPPPRSGAREPSTWTPTIFWVIRLPVRMGAALSWISTPAVNPDPDSPIVFPSMFGAAVPRTESAAFKEAGAEEADPPLRANVLAAMAGVPLEMSIWLLIPMPDWIVNPAKTELSPATIAAAPEAALKSRIVSAVEVQGRPARRPRLQPAPMTVTPPASVRGIGSPAVPPKGYVPGSTNTNPPDPACLSPSVTVLHPARVAPQPEASTPVFDETKTALAWETTATVAVALKLGFDELTLIVINSGIVAASGAV